MDDFLDSNYVETTNRYNDSTLPRLINNEDSITLETIRRFHSIGIKECNLDTMTSIDKEGYIVPLKKWIISTVYELFSSEQCKYSWNNKNVSDKKY